MTLEDYKEQVVFSRVFGKHPAIKFTSTAAKYISAVQSQKNKADHDHNKQKLEIVKTAAEIIQKDIKA